MDTPANLESEATPEGAATILADPPASETGTRDRSDVAWRGGQLGRLLERSSRPFVVCDLEGTIVFANLAFATLAGSLREELEGRHLAELCEQGDGPRVEETVARAVSSGLAEVVLCALRNAVGASVPVELTLELDESAAPRALLAFVDDLTERRRVETALRESEERFRRLYDEAPIGYHEVDAQGRIVNVNRTECELLGYTRDELVGRSVFDVIAAEMRETARQAFPDKISGKSPLAPFERTVVTRGGRRLVISIVERYKRDSSGKIVGLFSAMRDVTDQKRAEAALVASERRNRALFEGMEEACFVHALDGRILDANPAACRLLGYSRAEFLSMTTTDIDDPTFASGFEERLEWQLSQGHYACEGRQKTRDGRVIPVEINTSLIQLDEQRAVLAVLRDISERLALEQTRRELARTHERNAKEMAAKNAELTLAEARSRQLTECCLDGVVVIDGQGAITLFNPAAERMFGHSADEVLDKPIGLLLPRSFPSEISDQFVSWLESNGEPLVERTVELVGRRKSGEEFPVELSLSAVERGGETQFIGSIRDQTERHRMRAMLAQSEKLASIGLLSAGMAHEINNPLAYVANNVAVMERDLTSLMELVDLHEGGLPLVERVDPARAQRIRELSEVFDWPYVRENLPRMLGRTREGIQRIASIVSNLRGLARTSPAKMQATSIPDMVEGVIEMLRGRLRRNNIEFVVEHGTVPPLECLPDQISQVLLNLLINATQAVETSGRQEGGWVRFRSWVDGPEIVLEIADNGCGIPAENQSRLFDPFFTTKKVGEGTGLGLSICHGIVTGHGGRIEVDSRPGEGTAFRVFLPGRPAPQAPSSRTTPSTTS